MSQDAVYAAFERDIPTHLQEDAMTAMSEATSGWGSRRMCISFDHDRIDAINCRAHGIITIEGEEYTFQMEDGNRNGTVLLAWNDGREFEQHQPTRWALQPQRHLIDQAIMANNGPFLLLEVGRCVEEQSGLGVRSPVSILMTDTCSREERSRGIGRRRLPNTSLILVTRKRRKRHAAI